MKKFNKIILAGGSGYLGKVLAGYYRDKAEKIIILSRHYRPDVGNMRTICWDGRTEGSWVNAIDGAELLINLCGKNVNCRYTAKNQEEIIRSRVEPTVLLGKVIPGLQRPPQLWINLSSATIYRHAEDRPQDEETGDIGRGFSIEVCRQWEHAFWESTTPQTRKVALRMSIVFGLQDGALPRLLNLAKFGLGGAQGDGQQYVSWVHEYDAARSTEWIFDHPDLNGVINCVAPVAIRNKDLMHGIRQACGVPFGLPCPGWLLKAGMALVGSETELVLKSRWVSPQRLLNSGFKFQFAEAPHAVHDLLSLRV